MYVRGFHSKPIWPSRMAVDAKLKATAVTRKQLGKGDKVLPSVKPNLGLQAAYRKKIEALIDEMHRSVLYWIKAAYRANEPEIMAEDAKRKTPASLLQKELEKLRTRWVQKFDTGAEELGRFFAEQANKRSDAVMKKILKDSGFTVEFKMTPQQRDVMEATIHENVSLIKSIPQKYLKNVEGAVMRSVQTGRDLQQLTEHIEKSYKVERRRAAFIARDQNNKATTALNRSRQIELGITEAIWQHSSAGKTPRKTHLQNDGKKYDVRKGWYDPSVKEYIQPGQLPSCRCTSRSVIPGFI